MKFNDKEGNWSVNVIISSKKRKRYKLVSVAVYITGNVDFQFCVATDPDISRLLLIRNTAHPGGKFNFNWFRQMFWSSDPLVCLHNTANIMLNYFNNKLVKSRDCKTALTLGGWAFSLLRFRWRSLKHEITKKAQTNVFCSSACALSYSHICYGHKKFQIKLENCASLSSQHRDINRKE